MKVAILIINYNGEKYLADCLNSLLAQTLKPECIVVVENGSADGSRELLSRRYPQVVALEQATNLGFAEGNNAGIDWIRQNIHPDAIALVNNDTRAEPGWLAALVGVLEADASLGSAASRMVYASDPGRVNDAGDMPLWDGTGVARGRHEPSEHFDRDAEVFGACAGAAIYRALALEEAAIAGKVFDPDYFAYNEDVDLSWRLQRHGWRCRYAAAAKILHHHSGTSGRFSTWVLFHGERNRCWTLLKNFSWWIILISPLYTLARYWTVLAGPENGPHGTAANYRVRFSMVSIFGTLLKAWLAALAGAPRMLVHRWKYGLGWPLSAQRKILRELGARLDQTRVH